MRSMYLLSLMWSKLKSLFLRSGIRYPDGVYKVIDRRGRTVYFDAKTGKFVKAPE